MISLMRQLRYIVLLSVLSTGGQCGSYQDEYCKGVPGSHPDYLEIENLTGEAVRVEFHEGHNIPGVSGTIPGGGEFFFDFQPGEVNTILREIERREEGPLPWGFFRSYYAYDSIVVVVGDRREVFFRILSCNPSPSCTSPTHTGNSPDWESSWNPFIWDKWRLIEEPRDICKRGSGSWVRRFSLRPK